MWTRGQDVPENGGRGRNGFGRGGFGRGRVAGRGGRGGRNSGQHSVASFRPQPVNLEEQLERNMKEWGIDRCRNEHHQTFWDDHLAFVRGIRRGDLKRPPAHIPQCLSSDAVEAFCEVLSQELLFNMRQYKVGQFVVHDRIKDKYPELPTYIAPFAYDHTVREYRLREMYEALAFEPGQFDPLVRFSLSREPVEKVLHRQYVDKETGNPWSVVVRALVASTACQGVKCVHCASESLRWNTYDKDMEFRYWKKMVCEQCGSVYEIKSALTRSVVKSRFEKFFMNGNCFSAYHAVQVEMLRGAKQYVVVLCEEKNEVPDKEGFWPVYFAAIDKVSPLLRARSFCPTKNPKVYSKFTVDRPAQISDNLWFHVPVVDDVDWRLIASGVIDRLLKDAENNSH